MKRYLIIICLFNGCGDHSNSTISNSIIDCRQVSNECAIGSVCIPNDSGIYSCQESEVIAGANMMAGTDMASGIDITAGTDMMAGN